MKSVVYLILGLFLGFLVGIVPEAVNTYIDYIKSQTFEVGDCVTSYGLSKNYRIYEKSSGDMGFYAKAIVSKGDFSDWAVFKEKSKDVYKTECEVK